MPTFNTSSYTQSNAFPLIAKLSFWSRPESNKCAPPQLEKACRSNIARPLASLCWGGVLLLYIGSIKSLFVRSLVFLFVLDLPLHSSISPFTLAPIIECYHTSFTLRPCARSRHIWTHFSNFFFVLNTALFATVAARVCRWQNHIRLLHSVSLTPSSRLTRSILVSYSRI